MKAILFKNGIYVGVDTNVDRTLDGDKIEESEDFIYYDDNNEETSLYGNRVEIYPINHRFRLCVDGIYI